MRRGLHRVSEAVKSKVDHIKDKLPFEKRVEEAHARAPCLPGPAVGGPATSVLPPAESTNVFSPTFLFFLFFFFWNGFGLLEDAAQNFIQEIFSFLWTWAFRFVLRTVGQGWAPPAAQAGIHHLCPSTNLRGVMGGHSNNSKEGRIYFLKVCLSLPRVVSPTQSKGVYNFQQTTNRCKIYYRKKNI